MSAHRTIDVLKAALLDDPGSARHYIDLAVPLVPEAELAELVALAVEIGAVKGYTRASDPDEYGIQDKQPRIV